MTGNLKMRLHVEQDSKTGHVSALLTCRRLLLPLRALLLHKAVAQLISGAIPLLQIHFKSLKEGRLIKKLVATFEVKPAEGRLLDLPGPCTVTLATPPALACLRALPDRLSWP